jgi:hypothetical protein
MQAHCSGEKFVRLQDNSLYVLNSCIVSGRLQTLYTNTLRHIIYTLYAIAKYCIKVGRSPFDWKNHFRFLIVGDDRIQRNDIGFTAQDFVDAAADFGHSFAKKNDETNVTFCSKTAIPLNVDGFKFYMFKVSKDRLLKILRVQKISGGFEDIYLYYMKLVGVQAYFICDPDLFEKIVQLMKYIIKHIFEFVKSHNSETAAQIKEMQINIPLNYDAALMRYFPTPHGSGFHNI